jgi:hypothetical protein
MTIWQGVPDLARDWPRAWFTCPSSCPQSSAWVARWACSFQRFAQFVQMVVLARPVTGVLDQRSCRFEASPLFIATADPATRYRECLHVWGSDGYPVVLLDRILAYNPRCESESACSFLANSDGHDDLTIECQQVSPRAVLRSASVSEFRYRHPDKRAQ